jgi:hypothetical protein
MNVHAQVLGRPVGDDETFDDVEEAEHFMAVVILPLWDWDAHSGWIRIRGPRQDLRG